MSEYHQANQKLEDPRWLVEALPKKVVYSVPGMDKVKAYKDLLYKRTKDRDLLADVYVPPNLAQGESRPGVIFVHGGYLPPNLLTQPKDWGVFKSYGQLVAASGFVGITFNHRYYGRDHLDIAQNDIIDLVDYAREHASEFSLDKDRLCVWAFSGGGPLISWLIRTVPAYLRVLVLYYSILELRPNPPDGLQISDAKRLEFSPVNQLKQLEQDIFPILIARAGLDRAALNTSIDHFVVEALSKNIPLDLKNHPEGRHGFDLLDNVDRSRQIIQQTIEFIRFNT